MGPYVDSIVPDERLPATAAVVIIGGGIIGVSAALWLARRGIAVVLCEKGHVAGEQSSRNWGWCRQAGRDEREMPLIVESMRQWRMMSNEQGLDTGYEQCETLYVSTSEHEEQGFEQWLAMAKPYEIGARMVRGEPLARLMPGAARTFRSGLHVPTDGRAEPQSAVPAMARAAQAAGARIITQCPVLALQLSAGRISGVVTSRGTIASDTVLLAGGAWSSGFCASLGIRLPQLKVLGSVMRTAPIAGGPETCGWVGDLGYRKRRDGGYTLALGTDHRVPVVPDSLRFLKDFIPQLRQGWKSLRPVFNQQSLEEWTARWRGDVASTLQRNAVLDPLHCASLNRRALAAMTQLYPAFGQARVVQHWGGYIDVTPDVVPYIGGSEVCPGLTVATGFSGHGFGIGPAAGQLAAAMAIGQGSSLAAPALRLSRFEDGSPMVLGASI